jgi:lauroyl/myristoyl acyltransferase
VNPTSQNSRFLPPTAYRLLSILFSALLASLFFLSGQRARVVRRNAALLAPDAFPAGKGRPPRFFRWKLAFHAFQDLFSLFHSSAAPVLSPRSRAHLETLQSGPSVLLAAHFHNWEAQASALARWGVPLLGGALPLTGSGSNRLLGWLRARNRVPVVVADVPRRALRHLRAGGCFGFLWDQHAPGSPRTGTFFGRPVLLNPLPLVLLERAPGPVFFGAWLPGGEIRLIPLLSRLEGAWQARLERRYHRVLQTLVRRHPVFWYGFLHARFKNLGPYPGHRKNVGR